MHSRPGRRTPSRFRILNLLDTVPDDDLRAFSRCWNRTCAAVTACGLVAVVLVWLNG